MEMMYLKKYKVIYSIVPLTNYKLDTFYMGLCLRALRSVLETNGARRVGGLVEQ